MLNLISQSRYNFRFSKKRDFFNLPNLPLLQPLPNLPVLSNKNVAVVAKDSKVNSTSFSRNHLNLFGLIFIFCKGFYKIEESVSYNTTKVLKIGNEIISSFKAINYRGYVSDNFKFNPMFELIKTHLTSMNVKTNDNHFGSNINTYSLWFNFLILNLYYVITKTILEAKELLETLEEEESDKLADLENLRKSLFSLLDPYLKMQVQKRGITIIQNNYVGFDTEYELKNQQRNLNNLLSIQTALQTRTIIKIPLYNTFDISYIHPLTSEITNYYKPKVKEWNSGGVKNNTVLELNLINNSLKICIESLRLAQHSDLYKLNSELITRFHNIENVNYFEDLKKDQIVFSLPLTKPKTYISFPTKEYSLEELVNTSNQESCEDFVNSWKSIKELLDLFSEVSLSKLTNWINKGQNKSRSRTTIQLDNEQKISITLVRNMYLCCHYNASDLSMLSDFEKYKSNLHIVAKSFVTLGKPLNFNSTNLYVRDTFLLAPAGSKSLDSLSKLYSSEGGKTKTVISQEDKENMGAFLLRDRKTFEEYAINDALITLKHSLAMEQFNFTIKKIGVPLTISSLGRKFVLEHWNEQYEKYFPYQITGDCLMGNSDEIQTPKGLFATGDVGLHMSYFIGNYKGGRNESFMYGCDNDTNWTDYDLTNAYTTAMTHLSLPNYNLGSVFEISKINELTPTQLLKGYWIFKGSFKFPQDVKYPSIPCYVDKTTTVYPLQGECLLTGPELLLARNQKCEFAFKSAYYIPPTEKEIKSGRFNLKIPVKPFQEIIQEVQSKRREYPKGDFMNMLYKELGNSMYGNIVRGMSNKKSFDTLSGKMIRVTATEISNPILASWTTAFVRSVIGECLDNIKRLGGKVVSVTTDGFITNLENLENKLLKLKEDEIPLLLLYRELRGDLTENNNALEVKSSGVGIISWKTRGQLGINSKIIAMTGFQSQGYTREELVTVLKQTLASKDKEFEYTQSSLRTAKDIYKKGGHVTQKIRDQKFRVLYDNRRCIVEPKHYQGWDMSNQIFDSKPLQNSLVCSKIRFLSKLAITIPYLKTMSNTKKTKYKSFIEVGVRNFVKGYLAEKPCFGLRGDEFKRYNDLISFIHGFSLTKDVKLSKQSISSLKQGKLILRPVTKTKENVAFAEYLHSKIPYFDKTSFLKI